MTLLEHLKNINAKSKEKMEKEEGLWIGMITEDLEHWKNYGITTPAQLDRYFLETDVYEMHKSAYGVKGRHYEFSKMSDDDLKKEFEHLCKVAQYEMEQEEKAEKEAYNNFEKQIKKNLELGASDRENAIQWVLDAEGLTEEKDTGYICYTLGLSYDKEYIFKTKH